MKNKNTNVSNDGVAKILRGEVSAYEAYGKASEKIGNKPDANILAKFQDQHKEAVNYWKSQARFDGDMPREESGAWGTFVSGFVGGASAFGDKAVHKAMIEGEEHGLNVYKDLLKRDDIKAEQVQRIKTEFIPAHEQRLNHLRKLS
jgi:hypothetical protein